MPELLANYSDGMGLTNKTKCLSAGNVFFPVSPALLLQLSSVDMSLISLEEDAQIVQGL